eukprot:s5619_g2.t2
MESGRAVFPPGKQEKFEGLGYSPAVACGPFLFVAGQVGVGDSGVVEDPEEQFRLAFEKLFALCREAAFFKVKKEFFPAPPYPAFTGLIEVNHYIVQGAVHEAQENYAEFHRKVFDEDGNFLHGVWQTYDTDKYAALCNMAVSKLYFSCGIVFLWTARMLAEVKQSLHLMHDLYCIPQLPLSATAKQMVYQVKDGDEIERFEILALNRMVRIMLTVLIALPKIGVAFILMLSGCRWLAATQSFGDLILNALALEFVIGIDELMFEAFTPEQTRSFIEQTKIAYPREGEGGIQNLDTSRNTLGIILNLAWSYMYLNDWQQVLPNFSHDIRAHCQSRFAEMYTLKCPFMGDPDECFPFGE